MEAIEGELDQKTKKYCSLENEFNLAKQSLSEREDRIMSMEAELTANEDVKLDLEKMLFEANSKVSTLEDEILSVKVRSSSLQDQLKEAHNTLADKDGFVKVTELKMANKSLEYSELGAEHKRNEKRRTELEQTLTRTNSKVASMEKEVEYLKTSSAEFELELE